MALAMALAIPGVASANVYNFGAAGSGVTLSAIVTTGAADNGGFDITAITGTYNGTAITGLSSAFDGGDNILFPSSTSFNFSGLVDGNGLSFSLAGGNFDNIYASGFGTDAPTLYSVTGTNIEQTAVTLTVTPVATAVPEPASFAIIGAGLVGLTLSRRRKLR